MFIFDLRELISKVYNVLYLLRTIGIVTLVGDDKSIDIFVYIYSFVIVLLKVRVRVR